MVKQWRAIAVLVVVLLAALLQSKCAGDRWSTERDGLVRTADSLRTETRRDSIDAHAARERADSAERVAGIAQDRAQRAITEADRLRALRRAVLAPAGQPVATVGSSDTTVSTDTLCEQETVALRSALDLKEQAIQAGAFALRETRSALDLETQSSALLRVSNAAVTKQLAEAEPPCRVLFFRCPSRTVVTVAGVIVGTVATVAVLR